MKKLGKNLFPGVQGSLAVFGRRQESERLGLV
jgi:hypothetical protein